VVAEKQTTKKEITTNMKAIIKSIAALALLSVFVFASERASVFGASKAAVSGYDPSAFFTARDFIISCHHVVAETTTTNKE
jgi:hypothetical protein